MGKPLELETRSVQVEPANSNFNKTAAILRLNSGLMLADYYPSGGGAFADHRTFHVAPQLPTSFTAEELAEFQEAVKQGIEDPELGTPVSLERNPKLESDSLGQRLHFGLLRIDDVIKEEGARFNSDRFTFVKLYPHIYVARMARAVDGDKIPNLLERHHLNYIPNWMTKDQIDVFQRLVSARNDEYQIRDTLMAQNMIDELGVLLKRSRDVIAANVDLSKLPRT
jgi:hypothetical protein